jgi:predicted nucleic acid-binding protein
LLDLNVVSRWFDEHPKVKARAESVPNGVQLFVSVITLGEMRFGLERTQATDPHRRDEYERWFSVTFPVPLLLTRHTASFYAEIRAEIFRRWPPKSPKQNHPERCYDKVFASELGIDENDLWIAAQAIERNLILVTNDRMRRIQNAAGRILDIEDWEA